MTLSLHIFLLGNKMFSAAFKLFDSRERNFRKIYKPSATNFVYQLFLKYSFFFRKNTLHISSLKHIYKELYDVYILTITPPPFFPSPSATPLCNSAELSHEHFITSPVSRDFCHHLIHRGGIKVPPKNKIGHRILKADWSVGFASFQ